MPEEWLIDGYNLLRDCPSGTPSPPRKSKASLANWSHRIAGFAAAKKDRRVLLVLDGQTPAQEWEALCTASFQILSSGNITADSVIEKYLCDNKGRLRMMVVTKDRAVARMARGSGAGVMEPAEFTRLLEVVEKEGREILFREDVRNHGFHRPFGDKLKDVE